MKFARLNESLDWITSPEDQQERLTRAKAIAERDTTFLQYMKLSVDPHKKIVGIPEGNPDIYKPKYDMPDGVSDTVLKSEYRRVSHFLSNGSVQNLSENKRIALWVNILEGLHWKEAQILTAIKDQVLLELYPNLKEILEYFSLQGVPEEETVINTTTVAPTTEAPINTEVTTEAPTTEAPIVETTTKKPRKPRAKKNDAKIEEKSE